MAEAHIYIHIFWYLEVNQGYPCPIFESFPFFPLNKFPLRIEVIVVFPLVLDPISIIISRQTKETREHLTKNFLGVSWKHSQQFSLISDNNNYFKVHSNQTRRKYLCCSNNSFFEFKVQNKYYMTKNFSRLKTTSKNMLVTMNQILCQTNQRTRRYKLKNP